MLQSKFYNLPIEEIIKICRRYPVQKLALFGSVLRDDFNPDSDIDMLVDFAPNASVGLLTLVEMQQTLSELLQRPVDLVPGDGLKPVIRDEVLNSAEVIYAA